MFLYVSISSWLQQILVKAGKTMFFLFHGDLGNIKHGENMGKTIMLLPWSKNHQKPPGFPSFSQSLRGAAWRL